MAVECGNGTGKGSASNSYIALNGRLSILNVLRSHVLVIEGEYVVYFIVGSTEK